MDNPLHYEEVVRCKKTRARVGLLRLKSTCQFGNAELIDCSKNQ